ncbi:MAG TPA: hypothetical protein VLK03_08035 [Nocardioides sp.]|nr:hypothetical protein [Nocardioides sp.]
MLRTTTLSTTLSTTWSTTWSTSVSAAALLGLTLLAPTGAAAAVETCQGQPATIVGQPGQIQLDGTEGPDVIVTNSASNVEAMGGDDLVCVTGDVSTFVRTDAGDDVVDATSLSEDAGGVFATLGAGDDTYLGSPADDEVITGDDTETDSGTDVVDTGSGTAYDLVYSGQVRVPNPDRISGDGLEIWWRGIPTATGSGDGGGAGTFRYYHPRDISRLRIDARAGTVDADVGATLQVRGFTSFAVDSDRQLRSVVLRGTARDESLSINGASPRTTVRAALGAGDDRVSVMDLAKGSVLSGGSGTDRIQVGSRSRVALSLARQRLALGAGKEVVTTAVTSFADATLAAPEVTLDGDGAANDLVVNACRSLVRGHGGPDEITARVLTISVGTVSCRTARRTQLRGDAGDDVLAGSKGPDLLVGGPGRDRADGGKARDTCEAEKERRCEVPR